MQSGRGRASVAAARAGGAVVWGLGVVEGVVTVASRKSCKRARCRRVVYARGLCRPHWQEDRGDAPAAVAVRVVDAVARKLRDYEERLPGVSDRPMSVLALSLAAMVDDRSATVSARATASRELRATLFELEQELPTDADGDGVDDLADGVQAKLRVVA